MFNQSFLFTSLQHFQQNVIQEENRASELVFRQEAKDAPHESSQNSHATADEEPPGEDALAPGNRKITE